MTTYRPSPLKFHQSGKKTKATPNSWSLFVTSKPCSQIWTSPNTSFWNLASSVHSDPRSWSSGDWVWLISIRLDLGISILNSNHVLAKSGMLNTFWPVHVQIQTEPATKASRHMPKQPKECQLQPSQCGIQPHLVICLKCCWLWSIFEVPAIWLQDLQRKVVALRGTEGWNYH